MKLPCGHTLEKCPDKCDGGPRVTWRPVVGVVFRGHSMDHGPGWMFKPDGQGGGTLTRVVIDANLRAHDITVQKRPLLAPAEAA